jgi:predicted Zn-dependent protease
MRTLRAAARWSALPALLLVLACSTNPATGHRQLNLYSQEQEIALGRQYDQQVVQEIGLYDNGQLQSYVAKLGRELAARSERPDLPWHFAVVDDPSVNAFALPGGYVYVTRGLMDHVGSEAELASVMGHEVGHVTARHQVEQLSKAQLTQIGLTLGMVLSPQVARYGDLVNLAGGLVFLKFSRDDERMADQLGLRYISRSGYPPQAMSSVFTLLSRVSRSEQGGRLPDWLATHPNPEDRLRLIQASYSKLPPGLGAAGFRREPYLQRLEGVAYGPDPREGFFRRGVFFHPQLGFAIQSPPGWKGTNQKQAVVWQPRDQNAVLVLTLARSGSARGAAQQFFAQQGVDLVGQWPLQPNGAVGGEFQANTQQGPVTGAASFVELGGRVYQLLGFAAAGSWRQEAETIGRAMRSFQRVSSREIGRVEPWRLDVVRLPQAMTLREFDRRYPSTVPFEKVALLNNADVDAQFPAGEHVKRVVGGVPGAEIE